MKLVILSGAPGSGKSTVAATVLAQKEHYFHLAYDSIKWSFSQYSSGKYYKEIHELMLVMLHKLCELKFNVIAEALHKESRENLIDVGKKYGYEIILINLEADFDVLTKRLDARKATGEIKMPGFTKEKFKELFDVFQSEKSPDAVTFRTDTANRIAEDVLKLL